MSFINKHTLFIILYLSGMFSCSKSTCPDPDPPFSSSPALQIYLTDSLDYGNCNCRIITATIVNADSSNLTWTDSGGDSLSAQSTNSVQVCPAVSSVYKAIAENESSFAETSILVGPKTECDAKQVTECTRVLIESINDLIHLYHAPSNPGLVPLSNSATYEGPCTTTATFGSAKLNGIYGPTSPGYFYKIVPMSLSCSFTGSGPQRDSIKAPLPEDFTNGIPAYLIPGERVFANILTAVPWSSYLFSMHWTGAGSGHRYLGVCPPKKEFISYGGGELELFLFHFFTPKPGCSFKDAYETLACKNVIEYSSIRRIFNPRIDALFCQVPFVSNYDFTGRNVKVTIERMDGSFIDAYLSIGNGEGNDYDGVPHFRYKEDRSAYPCP